MISNDFYISLRKTKVVDIDKDAHKLPPDWGPFKEFKVADYYCPKEWSNDGIFVAVKEGEPLWIDFQLNNACAVIPSVQRLNPITGESADLENGLKKDPKQNYLVLPEQKWLDGYAKDGKVYQFMITKAGESLAVNEYVLPLHMQDSHALGFAFFEPKNPPKPIRERDMYPNHYCATKISTKMTSPMWFSPTHTPENWKIASRKRSLQAGGKPIEYQAITKGVSICEYTLPRGTTKGLDTGTVCDFASATDSMIETSADAECMTMGDSAIAPIAAGGAAEACEEYSTNEGYGETIEAGDVVDILDSRFDDQEEVDDTDLDKASMGMGGRIEQNITTDNNTVEYYKEKPSVILTVYMALPEQFEAIMKRGKRQDSSREDRHLHSGDVGGVPIPLIKAEA